MAACRRRREAASRTGSFKRVARARRAAARAAKPSVLVANVLDRAAFGAVFWANCAELNSVGQGAEVSIGATRPCKSGGGVQPMIAAQIIAMPAERLNMPAERLNMPAERLNMPAERPNTPARAGCEKGGAGGRITDLSWRMISTRPYLGRAGGAMRHPVCGAGKICGGRFSLSVAACAR
ncbi:MAG: hypothetical protein ACJAYH_001277 [Celeribacter sp.]|jgi:hypothetical protein